MRRVAIVGAGWSGLACAIAASAAGAQVDVYEQREGLLSSPMHVAVVPNMMRDLAALGLADACVHAGFPYRSLAISNSVGNLRLEIPYTRLAGDRHPAAMGLQQQALSALLIATAQAHGIRIHWRSAVRALDFEGEAVALEFDDSRTAPADITLLATGADSALRDQHFPAALQAGDAMFTWWTTVLHRPAGLDQLTWLLAAPRRRALLVPVSASEAGLALIAPELDAALTSAIEAGVAIPHLRDWLAQQPKALAALAPLLADDALVQPLPVRSALLAEPWHRGSLLCVGDAAHLLPPHMAQSAPQAFEDAVVFGELLRSTPEAATLLQAFMRRRATRVRAVFEIAERASRWDHGPDAQTDIAADVAALAAVVETPA